MSVTYSTPQDVIQFTGMKPKDLRLETDAELVALFDSWLVQIKDYIDRNRNRDYHKEVADGLISEVPPGIHQIALRAASNMAAIAVLRRETPIVKQEDFAIRLIDDQIFTEAILKDLAYYSPKPRFRFSVVSPYVETEE